MGEAKRRKKQTGQGATPKILVNDFRVPDGMVALTLDVHGINPVTMSVEAGKLEETLRAFDQDLRAQAFGPSVNLSTETGGREWAQYVRIRSLLIDGLRQVDASGRKIEEMQGLLWCALWCAFNHPTKGNPMRRQVSEAIRKTGKVVEMQPLLNAADDTTEPMVVAVERKIKPRPMQ
jgi:hypothetical protein